MNGHILTGVMHVFGNNIDTDQIYPGQYLDVTNHDEMALHCFESASDSFTETFTEGDIVVAGTNFGCGSSRENAAIALKVRRVSCVIAKSFARIFYRNAINLGLPLLVCADVDLIATQDDVLEVSMKLGIIRNQRTGIEASIEPISDYALSILRAGGIKPLMRILDEKGNKTL